MENLVPWRRSRGCEFFRCRPERFFGVTDLFATSISERRASLTDSSVGNALATSGLSSTRLVPALYASKYLPRTPSPRSSRRYSGRSSSTSSFFIDLPFLTGCGTSADYPGSNPSRIYYIPRPVHDACSFQLKQQLSYPVISTSYSKASSTSSRAASGVRSWDSCPVRHTRLPKHATEIRI